MRTPRERRINCRREWRSTQPFRWRRHGPWRRACGASDSCSKRARGVEHQCAHHRSPVARGAKRDGLRHQGSGSPTRASRFDDVRSGRTAARPVALCFHWHAAVRPVPHRLTVHPVGWVHCSCVQHFRPEDTAILPARNRTLPSAGESGPADARRPLSVPSVTARSVPRAEARPGSGAAGALGRTTGSVRASSPPRADARAHAGGYLTARQVREAAARAPAVGRHRLAGQLRRASVASVAA